MEPFPPVQVPDEGYSEHPLNSPSVSDLDDTAATLSLRSPLYYSTWLQTQMPKLPNGEKSRLARAILTELPTSIIAEIVMNDLNPRLYIDFVRRLPTEICLKIMGYLDSISLVHVAMCCRGWYFLAMDRKLWERLYYLEGWRAVTTEILTAQQRMNEKHNVQQMQPQRNQSFEDGHVVKKRAVSDPSTNDDDDDYEMVDADVALNPESKDTEMSGTSLFGGPQVGGSGSSTKSNTSVIQHMGNLMMKSPSPIPDRKGKGKAIARPVKDRLPAGRVGATHATGTTPGSPSSLKSTLWIFDARDNRHKINWKHLYNMRRRLERNWERGRYVNFQLPHPDHPEEGHRECIYSLQFNPHYLVSGSRDRTLRIWDLRSRRLVRPPLMGHNGSVLCLQFDADPEQDVIVSGSSDSDVIIWKFSTGEIIQRLRHAHRESVLNVKFDNRILVTCSKDKSIKIFTRVALKPGDLGYGDSQSVRPVPINVRNYGYDDSPLNQLLIKPPYSMIGSLDGHGAAVNAVQICDREIVSASGDRHIKVWDWPTQTPLRTFIGHGKGIACVQYDGRRIVSGSSDAEVKVFDRETGLEVASLRAHTNLVRTVQAGFGDLPYSVEEDRRQAKEVDKSYFTALNAGDLEEFRSVRGRTRNAGSRRPEDITAYGAMLPPGGGGGPYGRIVSGSYDQNIIIWRRDKEGIWRNAHTLRQEDAATAAHRGPPRNAPLVIPRRPSPVNAEAGDGNNNSTNNQSQPPAQPSSAPPALQQQLPPPPPTPSYTHIERPIHATITPQTTASYTQMIDAAVPRGPHALMQTLTAYPTMLTYTSHIQLAIDREPDAVIRSQLRQVVSATLVRAQMAQNRIRDSVQQALSTSAEPASSSQSASQPYSRTPVPPRPIYSGPTLPSIQSFHSVITGTSLGATEIPEQSASTPTGGGPPGVTNYDEISQRAQRLRQLSQSLHHRQQQLPAPHSQPQLAPTPVHAHALPLPQQAPTPAHAHTLPLLQQQQPQQPHHRNTVPAPTQPTQLTPHQTHGQGQNQGPQLLTHGQTHPQPQMQTLPPAAPPPPPQIPQNPQNPPQAQHPHIAQADQSPARIFKLQFDARRIICCSQASMLVGWDFCNDDPELEEVSRFFGTVE